MGECDTDFHATPADQEYDVVGHPDDDASFTLAIHAAYMRKQLFRLMAQLRKELAQYDGAPDHYPIWLDPMSPREPALLRSITNLMRKLDSYSFTPCESAFKDFANSAHEYEEDVGWQLFSYYDFGFDILKELLGPSRAEAVEPYLMAIEDYLLAEARAMFGIDAGSDTEDPLAAGPLGVDSYTGSDTYTPQISLLEARAFLGIDADDSASETEEQDPATELQLAAARTFFGLDGDESEQRTDTSLHPTKVVWADLVDTETDDDGNYDLEWEKLHSRDWERVATSSHIRTEGAARPAAQEKKPRRRRRRRKGLAGLVPAPS